MKRICWIVVMTVAVLMTQGTQICFGKLEGHNYPNPCRDNTTIVLVSDVNEVIQIKIYTLTGELVRNLGETMVTAGTQTKIVWNGKNGEGNEVASGVYLCLLKGNTSKKIIKIVRIR